MFRSVCKVTHNTTLTTKGPYKYYPAATLYTLHSTIITTLNAQLYTIITTIKIIILKSQRNYLNSRINFSHAKYLQTTKEQKNISP
jgi:hypothetical protein